MNEVAQVLRLTSCTEESIPKLADELGIPIAKAQDTRNYWLRRLEGRCFLCGAISKTDVCRRCTDENGCSTINRIDMNEVLEQMDQSATFMTRTCSECGETRELPVSYIIRMRKSQGPGFFRYANWKCKKCLRVKNTRKSENLESQSGIRTVKEKHHNKPVFTGKEETMTSVPTKATASVTREEISLLERMDLLSYEGKVGALFRIGTLLVACVVGGYLVFHGGKWCYHKVLDFIG